MLCDYRRMTTVSKLVIVATLLLFWVQVDAQTWSIGKKNPAVDPLIERIEFWIGEWELKTKINGGGASSAVLRARWALGGYGILIEELHSNEESDFVSTIVYSVDPDTRQIVGASNNTLGNRKNYVVTVKPSELLILQTGEMFQDREGFNILRVFDVKADHYRLELRACSADTDECGDPTYSYVATRVR